MKTPDEATLLSRRRFLKYSIGVLGGLASAALAAPLIRYFISPALESGKGSWVAIASAKEIPIGKPTYVEYEHRVKDKWDATTVRKSAWVITQDGQNFTVFDPHCTHLGCIVSWIEEGWKGEGPYKGQPHFHSPCHDGIFTIDGTVVSGPPPRPLDRLEHKVDKGVILVSGTILRGGVS